MIGLTILITTISKLKPTSFCMLKEKVVTSKATSLSGAAMFMNDFFMYYIKNTVLSVLAQYKM